MPKDKKKRKDEMQSESMRDAKAKEVELVESQERLKQAECAVKGGEYSRKDGKCYR